MKRSSLKVDDAISAHTRLTNCALCSPVSSVSLIAATETYQTLSLLYSTGGRGETR